MSSINTFTLQDSKNTVLNNLNTNFSNLNADKFEIPSQTGQNGKVLTTNGTTASWQNAAAATGGTVTSVSVVNANGFQGSVATNTSTPAITLQTSISGLLKGAGNAITAATAGTDYVSPSSTETQTNKTLTTPTITKPLMNARNQVWQVYSPAAGSTATLDMSLSDSHLINLPAGNVFITFTNDSGNQKFEVYIKQDSVGSRTVSWPSGIRWQNSPTAPTLTTSPNNYDTFTFKRITTGSWLGYQAGYNA
jgi:hypothetical protein